MPCQIAAAARNIWALSRIFAWRVLEGMIGHMRHILEEIHGMPTAGRLAMTAYRLCKVAVAWTFVFIAVGCGAAAAVPMLRHYVVAVLNDPVDLPALKSDARIHYESGAEACALAVAALLPAAVERVEKAQRRPFVHEPAIGVYVSYGAYAKANGLEDPTIAATSRSGRVILSPRLCDKEFDRLDRVLTHELSHAHLFGWRFSPFRRRPPSWFTEGLAVMVSGGGGAEGMSEAAAGEAIDKGYAILVGKEGLWVDFGSIPFEIDPSQDPSLSRQRLAYRQAAMFVEWLSSRDSQAFDKLLRRIENGERFSDAFHASYAGDPRQLWRSFVSDLSRERRRAL